MQVAFYIYDPEKRLAGWQADLGKRRRVPGTVMGGCRRDEPPHDLVQYIVEAATHYEHGFWGLVARGATFRSTGRRRTKPGRAVIAQHRSELQASEHLASALETPNDPSIVKYRQMLADVFADFSRDQLRIMDGIHGRHRPPDASRRADTLALSPQQLRRRDHRVVTLDRCEVASDGLPYSLDGRVDTNLMAQRRHRETGPHRMAR